MKKIITILGSFGLVVTSTSNIIACHDENKNQSNDQTNDKINYDYDILSTLALNLCFFAYNQNNQKFKLQTGPLTYEICKISQPTEEITKAIWKEVGNQNFDFNKLIYLFIYW
ncbi:lipoprotein [Spiroplasma sp. DGKH1]|uniref:lipoprotein n=1 Tax=Spiroplasma sp. DGKH1 TaxID=3050074 RepID=UPI0034C5D258